MSSLVIALIFIPFDFFLLLKFLFLVARQCPPGNFPSRYFNLRIVSGLHGNWCSRGIVGHGVWNRFLRNYKIIKNKTTILLLTTFLSGLVFSGLYGVKVFPWFLCLPLSEFLPSDRTDFLPSFGTNAFRHFIALHVGTPIRGVSVQEQGLRDGRGHDVTHHVTIKTKISVNFFPSRSRAFVEKRFECVLQCWEPLPNLLVVPRNHIRGLHFIKSKSYLFKNVLYKRRSICRFLFHYFSRKCVTNKRDPMA